MSNYCSSSILRRTIIFMVAGLLSWGGLLRSQPADFRVTGIVTDALGHVQLEYQSETNSYYILYSGAAVTNIVVPSQLELGAAESGSLNAQDLPTSMAFFQVRRVSIQEPLDIDGDGLDDVYELRRSYFLNALNPTDATRDFDGDGFSNLQEYLESHDPETYDASSTVYVVDNPTQPDEFRELTDAVDHLNQTLALGTAGRVVVLTERPQEIETLSVMRILRIEAGPDYYQRATVSGVGGGMVTINSLEPIQFEGIRWTNTTSLLFNIGGDFRLMGNHLPATLVSVGGAGLKAAFAEAGLVGAKQGGSVNDLWVKGCSFSTLGLQLSGHVGAGTVLDFSNNTGSRLSLFGDAEFSGQVNMSEQLLDDLEFKLSLGGSARLSVSQHMQLNQLSFEGRAEGTPTIKLEGNAMGAADLKFLGQGHVTLAAADNNVSGAFSVAAVDQATGKLNFAVRKSLIGGDFTVGAYGETTLVMTEDVTVAGRASISVDGTVADLQATKGHFQGELIVETQSAAIKLTARLSDVSIQRDFRVSVPNGEVFLLVDLSKLIFGNSMVDIHAPKPQDPKGLAKSGVSSGEQRPKQGGGSSITLRDVQLSSTGDKTIQIENLEAPVTIEGGTIANSGSLPNITVNQVKGPIAIRGIQFTGGGIWVGNTESPVSIENNQFQLSGSGASSVGLNLVADNITVRSNSFNGGGDKLAMTVTAQGGTVSVANNTIQCGMGIAATVSQMQLDDNDFTTSDALSVASGQVTATKNKFRGSVVVSGENTALNLNNNELDGTLTLGLGSLTAKDNKLRGSVLLSGDGTLNLEAGELNGTLSLSAGEATAKNVSFQGSILILGDAVLGLQENQLAGVKITDGNMNGGLKDDPTKQGAKPEDVSSLVDFDNDPHHCADYPPPQYSNPEQTECTRPGVPPPG